MGIATTEARPRPGWHAAVYGPYTAAGSYGERRRRPPAQLRRQVLSTQGNRCLYCDNSFGTVVRRRGRPEVRLRLAWDHYVPYAYLRRNPTGNWVAACHVCNTLKRALLITLPLDSIDAPLTLQQARDYLRHAWERKGYHVVRNVAGQPGRDTT